MSGISPRGLSRVASVAWREFRQTVMTKAFLLSVVAVPILGGLALVVIPLVLPEGPPPLRGEVVVIDPGGEVGGRVRSRLEDAMGASPPATGGATAPNLLEDLGELAGNHCSPIPEMLAQFLKCLAEPMRAFVEHNRPLLGSELAQLSLAALLVRQIAFEDEAVRRQTGEYKSENEGGRARNGFNLQSFRKHSGHECRAGIGNPRRASIADEREPLPLTNLR